MAGINKRTIFFDGGRADGIVRLHDFALVMTGLGPMVEPFTPFRKIGVCSQAQHYDATDMMCRIDEIKPFPIDNPQGILGDHVHGTFLWPRTGR